MAFTDRFDLEGPSGERSGPTTAFNYSRLPQGKLSFEQARNLAELMTVYINVNFERAGDYRAGLDDMARRIQRDGLENAINWTLDTAAKQGAKNVNWRAIVEPYKTPETEARALVQRLYEPTKGSTTHFESYVKAAQLRTPTEFVTYWNEINKDKPTLLAKIPAEELAALDKTAAENRYQVVQRDYDNFVKSAGEIYAGKDITPNYDPSMDASKVINDRLAQFGYKASPADINRWNQTAQRMGTGVAIADIDRTLGLQGFDRAISSSGVGEDFRGVPLSGQLPSTYAGSSLYQPRDYTGMIINLENQATAGREVTPSQALVPLSKAPSQGVSSLAQTGSTTSAGIPISGVAQPSVGGNVPLPTIQPPVSNQGFIQSNLAPITPVTGGGMPSIPPVVSQVPRPMNIPQPLRGTLPASFANLPIRPPVPVPQQPMFPTPMQLLERVRQEDAARFPQPEPQTQPSTDEFIRQNEMRPPGYLNFANGGSVSSSGVRRLKMSGYQEGGEVTDDEFIQEMMTGTRPSDFPETSPVDTAVSDFISSRSKLVTDPKEFFRVMGQNIEEYHGKPLREDPEKYLMEQLGPGALAGIIKMPGGNYLAGQVEKALAETKIKIPWTEQQISEMPQVAKAHEKDFALNKFIETKLTKYVKNDMATERDPLRLQADKWATEQQPKLLAEKDAQIVKAKADMEKAQRERGVEPEMLTRSRARILELEKEREFIAERTGLHYVPRQTPELYRGGVNFARQNQGFPSTAVARSEAGKLWEDFSDRFLANRSTVEEVTAPNYFLRDTDAQRIMAENPWLSQVPPETQVRFLNSGLNQQDTGFKHMADELRNALNPNSGLPPSLQINTKDLEKMTVPQAADLVDRINAHRAVQKAEANKLAAQKSIEVYKEYPETEQGLRWVEIKIPEMPKDFKLPEGYKVVKEDRAQMQKTPWFVRGPDGDIISGDKGLFHATPEEALKNATEKTYREGAYPELESALKYEGDIMKHCVGGHCPDVISGQSRIFSLRDSTGRPHATVEVGPPEVNFSDVIGGNPAFPDRDPELYRMMDTMTTTQIQETPLYKEKAAAIASQKPSRIKQIKGVLNKKPEDEYIPFVQDFVKSQRWSSVGDMANTGLIDLRDNRALNVLGIQHDVGELRRIREAIKSDYITLEELRKFRSPGGYAAGGEVTDFIKRSA